MVYHGGFWRDRYDLGTAGHMCAALTRVGVATWNVEYRRVGRGGDQWPETEYDVARSSSFLEEVAARYHLDLRRTVAVGFSAGGQLAMWLAAHRPWFRGVVSLAGVSDLRLAWKLRLSDNAVEEFLGGAPDSRPDACPMNLHITVTQRLVHGQDDTEVPIEIARAYVRSKSEREVVNLTELHNTGHYELIDPNSNAWATVEQIILGLLGQ
jgi:acetyl esterase/lipase